MYGYFLKPVLFFGDFTHLKCETTKIEGEKKIMGECVRKIIGHE